MPRLRMFTTGTRPRDARKRRLSLTALGLALFAVGSQAAARRAIWKLAQAYGGALGYMAAYRCPHCSGWHIGHANARAKK